MTTKHTALVLGATGIIGRNLLTHLDTRPDWTVKAVSRRAPDFPTRAETRSLDLLSPDSLAGAAAWLRDVTHVFFAAYQEHADPAELARINVGLLRNTVEALEKYAPGFRHVSFIQGGKAYGAQFGLYKTPAKETDPRHFPPNFYYDQEDFLRDASQGRRWSWTALRPDMMMGLAVGNPMNLGNLIGVYASLCKALRVPLRFPSTPRAYSILANVTDATVLAKALEWSALDEACAGEVFNITNGDVFRWSQVFPRIADAFGIACADPQPFSLAEAMRDKAPVWDALTQRHGLKPHGLKALAHWAFGDFIFHVENDAFFDVNKARRFGFQEMHLDSADAMVALMRQLQAEKLIPA